MNLHNGNILDKVAQVFADMLKFVDSGRFQIIRVQNFVEQIGLRHNFRDVCHRRDRSNLFHQVAARFTVLFPGKVGKLYTVHQGIKPQCLGVVLFGGDQRRQFLPHQQGVLVGQRRIIVCVCVQLYIFKMLAHSKVVLIQLLHFANHIVHKSLAERN